MKLLAFSIAILHGLILCAQKIELEVSPDMFDQTSQVINSNLNSGSEIFEASKAWFNSFYKKNKDAKIHTEDENKMIFASTPSVNVHVTNIGQRTYAGSITYELKIVVLDNSSCEVSLSGFYHESSRSVFGSGGKLEFDNPECGLEELPAANWKQIKEEAIGHMEILLNSLQSALNDQ